MTDSSRQLSKYFGLGTGIALIVTSIVGSGVYKKAAAMAESCQSPEILLGAWVLAGIVTLLGVLSLAEIATLLPVSGGPYAYLKQIYGEQTGFLYGWASFACIQTASTAAIAYVFAMSLGQLVDIPQLVSPELADYTLMGVIKPFDNLGVKFIAVGLIMLLTLVNCRGVHVGGGVGNVITVIVLSSIVLITILAFASSVGSVQNLTTDGSNYPPPEMEQSFGFLRVLFVAMLASFWAYEGWINVGFVGDEISEPQKNVPRILILGILVIAGLYVMVNAAYLYIVPMDQLIEIGKDPNGVLAVEVVRRILGPQGAVAMSILIVITTLGCTNSTILTSSRIYYAMAKDRMFFKPMAYLDPIRKVPTISLIVFGLWSSLLVFSGSFDQLTDMLVFVQFLFYALVIGGVFILRKKMPNADRPYKVLGYPVVPVLYILFCIVLIVNTVLAEDSRINAIIGTVLTLAGFPIYFYLKFVRAEKTA